MATQHVRTTSNKEDGMLGSFPFRMRRVALDESAAGCVVVLCAEPGMGKSQLSARVASFWAHRGAWIRQVDLAGMMCDDAMATLAEVRELAIERAREGVRPVVVIRNVPALDECDIDELTHVVSGISAEGGLVLVCLHPELSYLVEEMPYAACLRTADLLCADHDTLHEEVRLLTHGIPQLVDACKASGTGRLQTGRQLLASSSYRSVLMELARTSIRPSLPLEDCRMRLAMLLLGSGTTEELVAVADRLDEDTLDAMEHDAPLFGVDCLAGTFSCAGMGTNEGFRQCCDAVRSACDQMPDVVAKATRVLAGRGDVKRAAMVCSLCASNDLAVIGSEWGVELICAGEMALVRRAVALHGSMMLPDIESDELTMEALSVLEDPAPRIRRTTERRDEARGGEVLRIRLRRRYVELLRACRDLDCGLEPGMAHLQHEGDDEVASALVVHLRARTLLLEGKFMEAHALLVDNVGRQHPTTLVSALLCDDFEVARTMIGERATPESLRAFREARGVLEDMRLERLRVYHVSLEQLLVVLAAHEAQGDFAEAINRADKMGDQAIRAALLVAAAVLDIRRGGYAASHVHARYVIEMSGGSASGYLVDVATLLDALVQYHLKDDVSLKRLAHATRPSPVSDLALLAITGPQDAQGTPRLRSLHRVMNPKDELWLLNVLTNDFEGDGLSQALKANAPRTWLSLSRGAVRRAERYARMLERSASPELVGTDRKDQDVMTTGEVVPGALRRPERIEIRALGGLEVLVDGQPVTARLRRRMVKPYLLLLAAARGHGIGMFEIIESLWPGIDLAGGRQKIYNANSELRKVIGTRDNGLDPITNNRGEGVVRLNLSVTTVDIDDFERAANQVLRLSGDDALLMKAAADAVALYRGDLPFSQYDARNVVSARRHELGELFVDVEIAGAQAALREGRTSQAVRMAKSAHGANDMREDVILTLIEALKIAGRGGEACAVYDAYAQRLISEESRPPAPGIRRMIEDIYHVERGRRGEDVTNARHGRQTLTGGAEHTW